MKVEIEIPDELRKKVEKYIEKGRYKNIGDFFKYAAETLLMAEDRKGMFDKMLKQ